MSGGWNTIESDAGVFTYLVENLGVKDVQFEELITLDPQSLRQHSPVYGVIFLFKYPTGDEKQRSDEPESGSYDPEAGERLFFARQTIQNACGTQALLSVLLNQDGDLDVGPQLKDFKSFAAGLPSEIRGEALSNSELIRDVHNSFARSSPFIDETQQRTATEEDDVYHFIAYTPIDGQLWELDGLQPAPISHGACSFDEFPDKVVPVLQGRIARYPAHEIRFNVMAVVRDPRRRAREIGDQQWLYDEERKRTEWQRENALRRHNFVGFIGEILKVVVRAKVKERDGDAFDAWVKDATARTTARAMERAARGRVEEGRGA